jgi:hypothetical protein
MPVAGVDAGIWRASAGRLCGATGANVRSRLLWQRQLLRREIRSQFTTASGATGALRFAKSIVYSRLGFTGLEFVAGPDRAAGFSLNHGSFLRSRSPDLSAGLRHPHLI